MENQKSDEYFNPYSITAKEAIEDAKKHYVKEDETVAKQEICGNYWF